MRTCVYGRCQRKFTWKCNIRYGFFFGLLTISIGKAFCVRNLIILDSIFFHLNDQCRKPGMVLYQFIWKSAIYFNLSNVFLAMTILGFCLFYHTFLDKAMLHFEVYFMITCFLNFLCFNFDIVPFPLKRSSLLK